MRLPARLQADDVARNLARAKLLHQIQNLRGVEMKFWTVPKAQTPGGRVHAATGEHVISLDRLQHGRSGEEIDVHSARTWDFDANVCRNFAIMSSHGGRTIYTRARYFGRIGGIGGHGLAVAACEGDVAKGIDEDSVAACGDIERYGSMRVAGVTFRICIDANGALLAPLLEGLQLKAKSVHQFAGCKRQPDKGSAGSNVSFDGHVGDGWCTCVLLRSRG